MSYPSDMYVPYLISFGFRVIELGNVPDQVSHPLLCPINLSQNSIGCARSYYLLAVRNRLNIGSCLVRCKIFRICFQWLNRLATFDKFSRSSRLYYINSLYLSIDSAYVCSLFSNSWFTMRMLRFLDSKIQQCELCFTHMHWSSMFGRVDLKFLYFATATVYGLCFITISSLLCVSHLDLVYLIPRSTCSICNSVVYCALVVHAFTCGILPRCLFDSAVVYHNSLMIQLQRVCTVLVLLGNPMPILFITHSLLLGSNPILSGFLFATV